MCSKLSVVAVKYLKREGRVLAWQHCLTHICQGRCNYLAEATGHRKNVIRSKIVPSCPQLPGQRFLDKSRSAVWQEELTLSCLGLSNISFKYSFDLVCSGYELQIILVKASSLAYMMKCLDMKSGLFACLRCHFRMCFRNHCSISETSPERQRAQEHKLVYQKWGFGSDHSVQSTVLYCTYTERWKEHLLVWGWKDLML